MKELVLHLKRKYFDMIRAGTKVIELRRVTAYWCSKLDGDKGRQYTHAHFVLGYAPLDEPYFNIIRAIQKIERTTIVHEEFGPEPVEVFAIHLEIAPPEDNTPRSIPYPFLPDPGMEGLL